MRAREGAKERTIGVVTSEVGGVVVGVEVRRVRRIEEQAVELMPVVADTLQAGAPLDLASMLGLDEKPEGPLRRVLVVSGQGWTKRLVVGVLTQVKTLAETSLRAVPPFLGGLGRDPGIAALFLDEERVGFLLDLDVLTGGAGGSEPS